MATTKLGNSKSSSRAINYAEKRAEIKSGHNCDVKYAKSSFKQLRCLHDKDDGVQAHTIIQSFRPGEVTAEKANEIGLELAKAVAGNHQVAIYTHIDKAHIHNHIIINSVNVENGKKYQSNAKQFHLVRNESDRICLENGLSIVTEKDKAKVRYTMAEQELLKKGKTSWKDEIRRAIDLVREEATTFDQFISKLERYYKIKTHLRGKKTITFEHPNEMKSRGNKLGGAYEREVLQNEFARKSEIERNDPFATLERSVSSERKDEANRTPELIITGKNEPVNRQHERNFEQQRRAERKERKQNPRRNEGFER